MPMGLGLIDMFDMVEYTIRDRIKKGADIRELGEGFKCISDANIKYYWYEKDNDIILAMDLTVNPQGLVVNAIGKNPKYKGRPPFASSLYDLVLNDNDKSIRILSDTQLSDEGYAIWKKLFAAGHKISVYDSNNPGKTFKTFQNSMEMDKYFKDYDNDYQRYQFILSESYDALLETSDNFEFRRLKEMAGLV